MGMAAANWLKFVAEILNQKQSRASVQSRIHRSTIMKPWALLRALVPATLAVTTVLGHQVAAPAQTPQLTPAPPQSEATPAATAIPRAQAYISCEPQPRLTGGVVTVPISFISSALGASVGPMPGGFWRVLYFGHSADFSPGSNAVMLDGARTNLPAAPYWNDGQIYVPLEPLLGSWDVKWRQMQDKKGTFLLEYPAARVERVTHSVDAARIRLVVQLSNPTRVVASQDGLDAQFAMAAIRSPGVPTVDPVNDYLVPRTVLRSGDFQALFAVRSNYAAPVQWFTLDNPPRLLVEVQRVFEQSEARPLEGGVSVTKMRRGLAFGPVQMYVIRLDPQDGWRIRLATGGYSVLQRSPTSRMALRHKALIAVNGGFFAFDGAAVGALLVDGEWMRLPWKGRTAIGFNSEGRPHIDNLQTRATVNFSTGLQLPVRELNGWPDWGRVTVLNSRFTGRYRLRPGEIGARVSRGKVISKPGSGLAEVPADGFLVIASGGAARYLQGVPRGTGADLDIKIIGWPDVRTALGGGPRLLVNGRVAVSALREAFKQDVRVGRGPRTAMGIDREGRCIIVVVDGRQKYHSVGLTLTELAYTMQKLGAVDAMNLDGGGSTTLTVRGTLINQPSDGYERSVSNALLVMR